MPSILIETGFLTNLNEEKFLNDTINQLKMSNAMFDAFESYRNELEGITEPKLKEKQKEAEEIKEVKSNPFVKEESAPPVKTEVKPKQTVETSAPTKPKVELKNPEEKKQNTNDPVVVKTATSKETSQKNNIEKVKVIFRVQVETSDKKINLTDPRFKGVQVYEYQQDKLYKYAAGNFEGDIKAARNYKDELIKLGFNSPFIVAFFNGERINLEKAIKLAEK